jgi:CheY-like chemotaxis protein
MNSSLKILIVEDEFFIALDTEEQAKILGHTVVGTAINADEAVRIVGETMPDVVLMDIRLSGERDGIAAATEIRRRFGVQTIFVTANTDPSTLQRARSIGPVGVLQKPLTPDRLKAQLSTLFEE